MKKNKVLKPINVMTTSFLLASFLMMPTAGFAEESSSPNNELKKNQAASSSSPIYIAPNYGPKEIFTDFTGKNSYIFYAEIDKGELYVDMTRVWKGYGMKITMPNGRQVVNMKPFEKNTKYWLSAEIMTSDGVKERGSFIKIETLDTKGKVIYNPDYIFPKQFHGTYDVNFGQAVYDLFGDSNFSTLSPGVTQGFIDNVNSMASKVQNSDEKTRLVNLINKAGEMLKQQQAETEKILADAKNIVEGLFTDNKFDTLKGSTNQAAIDEAQNAVNKLPASPEKNRLQDLANKANDLLKKKEQAEKDLNDAKNKVEDLFTNDKFDTLKGSTNQGA
ncbi:toxin Cry1Ac domain D-VI-related protein, partial [Peribacillus muralis]|uniref:toxin Cry1Ac domain D-VI-related protein n=1 Tax=Peribacillus muralis TaxID=264697 RepID=UPI00381896DE